MRGRLPSRQPTGLYVHSSPPTGVPVHDSVVRQWLRGGEITRLRELVLEGDGGSLVGEYSPDVSARVFLRALPRILTRIDEAHKAAAEGSVERVERAIKRERAVHVELSKDHAGLGLLHKAVIHGHKQLQTWLLDNYPETVHLTDRERRTALHYAGSSPDSEEVWKRLTDAGADPTAVDSGGNTPAYYMHHPRRARPPQPRGSQARGDKGLVIKPANIRIWIHDRDLGRLQKVVWEGYGQKLLSETSTQPKVRRFLSAVPYIMGSIRDIHKAAIDNDVDTLKKRTDDPVPKDILLSKDANGLNALHKAAGLGNKEAVVEIVSRAPDTANAQDGLGRTPLHYAAGLRDPQLYQLLVENGATDHLQDKKGNTPSYYRSKPAELDGSKLLNNVPEAPRTAHIFPPSWDWRLLQSPATGIRLQDSSEIISQESTAEEITQDDISRDDGVEERRPEVVSEDEGVGSENAQSVEDTASPQNIENIDMEPEVDGEDRLDRTITLSKTDLFGEDSGAVDIDSEPTAHQGEGEIEPNPEESKENEDEYHEEIKQNEDERPEEGNKSEDKEPEENNESVEISPEDSKEREDTNPEETNENGNENSIQTNINENPEEPSNNETIIVPENRIENVELTNKEYTGEAVNTDEIIQHESSDNNIKETVNPATVEDDGGDKESEQDEPVESKEYQSNEDEKIDIGDSEKNNSEAVATLIRSDTLVLDSGMIKPFEENQKHENEVLEGTEVKQQENHESTTVDDGKTESAKRSRPNQSGRQSLKSRVERAILMGRGQINITSDDSRNISGENLTAAPPEVEPEIESKSPDVTDSNNQESNEQDEQQEEISNKHEPALSTIHPGIESEGNDNESPSEREEKESAGEYFPDSLEGTPDTAILESEDKDGDTKQTEREEDKEKSNTNPEDTPKTESITQLIKTANAKAKGEQKSEAERLVAAGDMEGMAEMVLSGEGEALLDLTSDNPDVQLFINNVPQYMAKIERVHKASREGDLRGVQTSLDRRKFAVARDNGTSLKPTPLHVAVLFGRTSVLRYLAGRFPETMHAQDSAGRTPLHYATTLPDNGHFYSLLITLGADKAVPDLNGRTAEYYLRNKEELTREMLLAEYQDRPVPIDMSGLNFNRYSDKASRRYGYLTEHKLTGAEILREGYPIFKPEEGQYLASTLGEPLIKGLTEVAQLRPPNPIIHLANFLLAFKKPEESEDNQTIFPSIEGTPPPETEKASDENDNTLDDDENKKPEGEADEDEETMYGIENEDEDEEAQVTGEAFKPVNRDEHGQSMLHFAAARSHGRNAMYQLLQEMDLNPALRDSLYRTARDIAEQMEIADNIKGIDRYVVSIAARGEENKLRELLLEGYDHILDAEDGGNIVDIVEERGLESVLAFLKGISQFEENREKLHRAIRFGSLVQVQEIFSKSSGSKNQLALSKNTQGRCSLHVAVLSQHESTVEHIATKYPASLQIGDNLMRTPLHYAMGLEKVESLSRILIAAGAQRVLKDLKGRQPSYYFMNKTDIQKLQDEEEALRV